ERRGVVAAPLERERLLAPLAARAQEALEPARGGRHLVPGEPRRDVLGRVVDARARVRQQHERAVALPEGGEVAEGQDDLRVGGGEGDAGLRAREIVYDSQRGRAPVGAEQEDRV